MNEKARETVARAGWRPEKADFRVCYVVSRHFGGLIPGRQTNKLGLNAPGSSIYIEESMQINWSVVVEAVS